jgi:hypothetical protein
MPLAIAELKTRLQEQINIAQSQTTIGGFYNAMYGFVEIIENDPIFSEFVQKKIDQELNITNSIDQDYQAKKVTKGAYERAYGLHVYEAFWHNHYSLFKYAHDVIKKDKYIAQGIAPANIDSLGLFLYKFDDRDYNKPLAPEKIKKYIADFEECYNLLIGLINSDSKLLKEINQKNKPLISESKKSEVGLTPVLNQELKIESIIKPELEAPEITYNPNSHQGIIKYQDEKIIFDGRRALILFYFFNNQNGEKTYSDFNAWLKNNKMKSFETGARVFRQEIDEINGRLEKESKYLSSLIELVNNNQQNRTKANFYQYKIKLQK